MKILQSLIYRTIICDYHLNIANYQTVIANNRTIITKYHTCATILPPVTLNIVQLNSSVNNLKCVGTCYICFTRYSSRPLRTPEANSPLVITTTASVERWIALFATFILSSGINRVSQLTSAITRCSLKLLAMKTY